MFDIFHQWAGDLSVNGSGDLALCSSTTMTNQRIYRRLVTNLSAYVWHLNYGAGLGNFVGMPTDPHVIESVIRTQIQLESSVASSPAAVVTIQVADAANGVVTANIKYTDGYTGEPSQTSLELNQ